MNHETQRSLLSAAYRDTSGEAVAFVDESYLAPSAGVDSDVDPFYVMTAYVVPRRDLDIMRHELTDRFGRFWHSTRAHQSSDGRAAIESFSEYIGEGDEAIVVTIMAPVAQSDSNAESARAACFTALLAALARGEHGPHVELVVYEERKFPSQRSADSSTVRAARSVSEVRRLRIVPASPAVEILLWLPDLVSFAIYQRHARRGFGYADAFASRMVEIVVK